jgi:hypothetical protein
MAKVLTARGVCVAVALIAAACKPVSRAEDVVVLSTANAVRTLSVTQAERGHPVRLRGVATYYHAPSGMLIVQDGTGATVVDTSGTPAPLVAGRDFQFGRDVEVEGLTAIGEASTIIIASHVTGLHTGAMPEARRVSVDDLAANRNPDEWMQVEGIVRSAAVGVDRRLMLTVATPRGRFRARVNEAGFDSSIIDARVRIRGAAHSIFNLRGQPVRLEVLTPALAPDAIQEASPVDPFASPVESIAGLALRAAAQRVDHRVHIQGVVTIESAGAVFIQDETGRAVVGLEDQGSIRPGRRMDVLGFIAVQGATISLEDAVGRAIDGQASGAALDTLNQLPSSPTPVPVLRTVQDIRRLSAAESRRGYPVHVRGVVTAFIGSGAFIQDETAGIYVSGLKDTLAAGQRVEIDGQSSPGNFAPIIANARSRILGNAELPTALQVPVGDLMSGRYDSRWVEVEGVVQSVNGDGDRAVLTIVAGPYVFNAMVTGFANRALPTSLVDATVSVRGACGTIYNERRQLTGIRLNVPSLDQVTVREHPLADPFSLKVQAINTLMTFDPIASPGHRVRVQGVVILAVPHGSIFVKDSTGGVAIQTSQREAVAPGDRVDVAGFAASGDYRPILRNATFRKLSAGASPHHTRRGAG